MMLVLIGIFLIHWQVDKEACYAALSTDMLSTDLAYYAVRKGVSYVSLSYALTISSIF